MSLLDPLKDHGKQIISHHMDSQETRDGAPTMWPQQQLSAQTKENTNAVRGGQHDGHWCLCPQPNPDLPDSANRFCFLGTSFPAHCTINFEILGKKSKECFDSISGFGLFCDCFSYLLSNFFLHFYWRAQFCNLFDAFAGISSVLPQHVILGVGSTNDRRPVIGPT